MATAKKGRSNSGASDSRGAPTKPRTANASSSVDALIAALPAERRADMETVRQLINAHLPPGYVETTAGSMIAWVVPLDVYPDTYNRQALWYAGLASGKGYMSLHAVAAYMNPPLQERLRAGFAAAGKKLDMGKGCIRFRRADDLALDVIADLISSTPLDRYVAAARAAKRPRK